MQLLGLPYELLCHIISLATDVHPRPADVLAVNRLLHSIAEPILYGRLILLSASQLQRCALSPGLARHVPKSISLNFAGRIPQAHTFSWLAGLLRVLIGAELTLVLPDLSSFAVEDDTPWGSLPQASSQLTLNTLCFCMHSLQRAEYITIFYALSHAK
jgi:hypothetical protein